MFNRWFVMLEFFEADLFDRTLFGSTILDWLILLVVWFGIAFFLVVTRRFVAKHFSALAERTANRIDDVAAELVRDTKGYFLVLVAVVVATLLHPMPDSVNLVLRRVAFLALLLQIGQWGSGLVLLWIADYTDRKVEEDKAQVTAIKALGFGARVLLWTVLVMMGLDNLGIDITSLVAGLGITGIAVALAVQNVLQDVLAYVSIVVDQPFVYGDFLIVDDHMGTVEHIGIKTTRLKSLSGEQLVFSNSDLLSSRIRNFKRMYERRVVFGLGIVYDTPYEKVELASTILREAVERQEEVRFDRAHFKNYGDSSLDFEVVYYVLKPDYTLYMDIQQAINLFIYRRFEEESIGFAFPTRTLHVETMPALTVASGNGPNSLHAEPEPSTK